MHYFLRQQFKLIMPILLLMLKNPQDNYTVTSLTSIPFNYKFCLTYPLTFILYNICFVARLYLSRFSFSSWQIISVLIWHLLWEEWRKGFSLNISCSFCQEKHSKCGSSSGCNIKVDSQEIFHKQMFNRTTINPIL